MKGGNDMDREMLSMLKKIKERHARRLDGGPGSGNWGHVGVIGQHGGSASGGGAAFRMENKGYNPKTSGGGKAKSFWQQRKELSGSNKMVTMSHVRYVSKATTQNRLKDNVKKCEKAGKKFKADVYRKQMDKVEMRQKSVKTLKKYGEFDPAASKSILADKARSKSASSSVANARGTKEAISKMEKKKGK